MTLPEAVQILKEAEPCSCGCGCVTLHAGRFQVEALRVLIAYAEATDPGYPPDHPIARLLDRMAGQS